jgi:hypothetical protein
LAPRRHRRKPHGCSSTLAALAVPGRKVSSPGDERNDRDVVLVDVIHDAEIPDEDFAGSAVGNLGNDAAALAERRERCAAVITDS